MAKCLIDPVTKKFVSPKSERGMELLRMQEQSRARLDGIEEEESPVYLAPEEEEEETSTATDFCEDVNPADAVRQEQETVAAKYADIESFRDVPYIKERIESGLFKVTNTARQDKNGTLSVEVMSGQLDPEKPERFVFYKSTGHIVRNGKTFIHRGYKDCGNLAETCEAFEKYWSRREQRHLRSLERPVEE